MPNWCTNRTTITGPEDDVARFVAAARGPTQTYAPTADDLEDEKRLREQAEARGEVYVPSHEIEHALSFHRLVPIPDAIQAGPYHLAGYNAERELWGVKWGARDTEIAARGPGVVVYEYETPWGPARELWRRVARAWPSLRIATSWSEEWPTKGRFVAHGATFEQFETSIEGPQDFEFYHDGYPDESDWDREYHARLEVVRVTWRASHDAWAASAQP